MYHLLFTVADLCTFSTSFPFASCQTLEGFILLLFQGFLCRRQLCMSVQPSIPHIQLLYMILRDDDFPGIEDTALASSQFPINNLHLPLESYYTATSYDHTDRLHIFCHFVNFIRSK